MALITPKPRKEYEKPKPGLHLAVLADVISVKNIPTLHGLKNKSRYVWILEKKDSEGNNFQVRSRPLNDSTDPASGMYETSTAIRNGKPIPPSFDPESLIGSVNILGIIHAPGVDKRTSEPVTWVNVSSINPAEEGQTLTIPAGFVRDKDKPARDNRFGNRPQQAASVS